jgi:hypothetical protein
MRTLVCLGVALLLVTAVRADDKKDDKNTHGKVVRVNADTNTITIRCEDKEKEFKVADTTKIWGNDKKPLAGGLKGADLKEGTEVWFVTGTGAEEMTITELRLFNPKPEK